MVKSIQQSRHVTVISCCLPSHGLPSHGLSVEAARWWYKASSRHVARQVTVISCCLPGLGLSVKAARRWYKASSRHVARSAQLLRNSLQPIREQSRNFSKEALTWFFFLAKPCLTGNGDALMLSNNFILEIFYWCFKRLPVPSLHCV